MQSAHTDNLLPSTIFIFRIPLISFDRAPLPAMVDSKVHYGTHYNHRRIPLRVGIVKPKIYVPIDGLRFGQNSEP